MIFFRDMTRKVAAKNENPLKTDFFINGIVFSGTPGNACLSIIIETKQNIHTRKIFYSYGVRMPR